MSIVVKENTLPLKLPAALYAQGWYSLQNNPWGSAQKQVLGGAFVKQPYTVDFLN